MFKANIVESREYYKLRKRVNYIFFFVLILASILINIGIETYWVYGLILAGFIADAFYLRKLNKLSLSLFGKRKIVLDLNSIKILGQNKKLQEEFTPSILDRIDVYTDLQMSQETMKEVFKGQFRINCIMLEKDGRSTGYYFEFDSYYMITQLEKILKHWKVQSLNVHQHEGLNKEDIRASQELVLSS